MINRRNLKKITSNKLAENIKCKHENGIEINKTENNKENLNKPKDKEDNNQMDEKDRMKNLEGRYTGKDKNLESIDIEVIGDEHEDMIPLKGQNC